MIFNRVGSDHHEELLREALGDLGVPVLGALRRDERVATPERHLGLVPGGRARGARARGARHARRGRRALRRPRRGAAPRARAPRSAPAPAWSPSPPAGRCAGARIAIARGPAFSFHYEENLELLEAAGAELQPFDPLQRRGAPGGRRRADPGRRLPRGLRRRAGGQRVAARRDRGVRALGRPVLAECGGLLYLAAELDGQADVRRAAGARDDDAPADARLPRGDGASPPRRGSTPASEVRGHEFHYSQVEPLERRRAGRVDARRARDASAARASSPAACRRASCTCTGRRFPQIAEPPRARGRRETSRVA